jgi:4-amino-4-deoxy-L-arabinose transferase-like glycosyltransferase
MYYILGSIGNKKDLFAGIISPFYVIIGPSEMAGRIGVAMIGLLVGYYIFAFVKEFVNYNTALLSAGIVLFWPTIFFRSVVIQREVILTMALMGYLWIAKQSIDNSSLKNILTGILFAYIVYVLRPENVLLLAIVASVAAILKFREKTGYMIFLSFLIAPIIIYILLNFGSFTGYGTVISPEAIDAFAHGRDHGKAAYLTWLHYESWLDILIYAPLKIIYFLFTPFPWHVRDPAEAIVGISAIALICITVLSRRGIALIMNDHKKDLLILLSYTIVGITAYAIVEMNYGAAVRRRIQFIPIIILLAVVGFSRLRIKIRGIR